MPGMYGRKWAKVRAAHLTENPYCVYCEQEGRGRLFGNVVDHIIPHHGDPLRFWDLDNLQTLCKEHHDGAKQAEEKGAPPRGCDASGVPLDVDHHWHN